MSFFQEWSQALETQRIALQGYFMGAWCLFAVGYLLYLLGGVLRALWRRRGR